MPKISYRVGPKAAQTLYYAEEQADRIGLPINISITLNMALLGVTPQTAAEVFQKLRNQRFSPWVRRDKRQGCIPTYTYGFENSRDDVPFTDPHGPHNIHVHWAVHVPHRRHVAFEGELHRWIDEIAGSKKWPSQALRIKPVTSPGSVCQYPIKGASQAVAEHYGVAKEQVKAQGIVMGKRTGTSTNLGPAARRALDKKMKINRLANMAAGRARHSQIVRHERQQATSPV